MDRTGQRMVLIMAVAVMALIAVIRAHQAPAIASETPPAPPVVGEAAPPGAVRIIDKPGEFGLGPALPDSDYAIVQHHLVRIDRRTGRILSILRPLPHLQK